MLYDDEGYDLWYFWVELCVIDVVGGGYGVIWLVCYFCCVVVGGGGGVWVGGGVLFVFEIVWM